MALPTLDATFASSVDLPRRQMLARWLVGELGETQTPSNVLVSGAGSSAVNGVYIETGEEGGKKYYNINGSINPFVSSIFWNGSAWLINDSGENQFYTSADDTEFPWQVTTWSGSDGDPPAPTVTEITAANPIANYLTLPERYLWAKIAVAAGAPRSEADYISLPKNYAWSDIYNAVSGDIANSAILVSGAGIPSSNGTYVKTGFGEGKPLYNSGLNTIAWSSSDSYWYIFDDEGIGDVVYISNDNTSYPWQATNWTPSASSGIPPAPILNPQTPNHTDWSEKQALGHIAAAYRGDTGNAGALATYIDWPWRYQVASIIGGIFPSNGLLAFWKLADLTDASGNGNTLTNTNSVTFGAGKIGNAAQFDGSNYLSTNAVAGFNPSNDYSISFWAKPSVLVNYFTLIGNASTPPTLNMHSSASGNLSLNNALAGDVSVSNVFTAGAWVHVVITRNSGNASVYKNGLSVYSAPFGVTYGIPTSLQIGGLAAQGGFFMTGQMDAVGIWNRALSEPEIARLYNNGNGLEP